LGVYAQNNENNTHVNKTVLKQNLNHLIALQYPQLELITLQVLLWHIHRSHPVSIANLPLVALQDTHERKTPGNSNYIHLA